jgi:hypothetical protein
MRLCCRLVAVATTICLSVSLSEDVRANDLEWVAGLSWTSGKRSTSVTFGEWLGSEHRLSANLKLQPAVGAGWISGRHDADSRLHNEVWMGSIGARLPNI